MAEPPVEVLRLWATTLLARGSVSGADEAAEIFRKILERVDRLNVLAVAERSGVSRSALLSLSVHCAPFTVFHLSFYCPFTCPSTVLSLSFTCPFTAFHCLSPVLLLSFHLSFYCPFTVFHLSFYCPFTVFHLSFYCPFMAAEDTTVGIHPPSLALLSLLSFAFPCPRQSVVSQTGAIIVV